jgi:phage FluMu protein Com
MNTKQQILAEYERQTELLKDCKAGDAAPLAELKSKHDALGYLLKGKCPHCNSGNYNYSNCYNSCMNKYKADKANYDDLTHSIAILEPKVKKYQEGLNGINGFITTLTQSVTPQPSSVYPALHPEEKVDENSSSQVLGYAYNCLGLLQENCYKDPNAAIENFKKAADLQELHGVTNFHSRKIRNRINFNPAESFKQLLIAAERGHICACMQLYNLENTGYENNDYGLNHILSESGKKSPNAKAFQKLYGVNLEKGTDGTYEVEEAIAMLQTNANLMAFRLLAIYYLNNELYKDAIIYFEKVLEEIRKIPGDNKLDAQTQNKILSIKEEALYYAQQFVNEKIQVSELEKNEIIAHSLKLLAKDLNERYQDKKNPTIKDLDGFYEEYCFSTKISF